MKDIFLKVMFNTLKKLHAPRYDLSFLPERIKIGKVGKLVANLHDKTEYVIRIRNLKQALNHRLTLKNIHRVIKSNQSACLKPYIDMNTGPSKKAKNDFEKYFLS